MMKLWLMKLCKWFERLFRTTKREPSVDFRIIHLPSFSGLEGDLHCVYCGKLDAAPEHLHPDVKIRLFNIPRDSVPLQGTLTEMAARVIEEDPGAVLMEEYRRFPFIVFVQLTDNDLLPKVRRALWYSKPCRILVVVLGIGKILYTLEEQESWLIRYE